MPELPPPKRQPVLEPEVARLPAAAGMAYAELHCRTNFSFLEGASHPDELVQTAQGLAYRALAITDRNSLAGVVRAHVAAKAAGLKLLVGAEITPVDAPPVVLLATDRAAYGRLCRLLTRGRRNAPKGECRLTLDDLAEHAGSLLACVVLKHCWRSGFSLRRLTPDTKAHHSPSPLVGEGRGGGGERRLPFPPPSQPSPIKGEGVQIFDRWLALRHLCRYQCRRGRGAGGERLSCLSSAF